MGRALSTIFQFAGLVLGLYIIWPDVEFFMKVSSAAKGAELEFLPTLERGEHAILYVTLVLLPAMNVLDRIMGHKCYSALAVLLFSALCVLFARVLHTSLIDGYVFLISKHTAWETIARPAAILSIVAGNWLIAFSEMYRVVKVAGK